MPRARPDNSRIWRNDQKSIALDLIVATPQDSLAEVAAAAAGSGRHVLVEKPAGRRPSDVPVEGHALWPIATAEVAEAIIVDRHVPIEFFHAMALSQIRTPHK